MLAVDVSRIASVLWQERAAKCRKLTLKNCRTSSGGKPLQLPQNHFEDLGGICPPKSTRRIVPVFPFSACHASSATPDTVKDTSDNA